MAISSNQNASAPSEKNKQPPPVTLEVDEETMKFKAVNIPICDAETLISLLDSTDNAVCNMSLEYLTKFAEICKKIIYIIKKKLINAANVLL